jgi:exopolysaccharide production protein ExoZ
MSALAASTETLAPLSSSADRNVVPIEHLRALAAASVVVFHALGKIADAQGHLRGIYEELGAAGVDVFFVISGFIMWVSASRSQSGPLVFWRRRIVRVVPLYWMLTTVVLGVMIVAPSLLDSRTDIPHALASYFFVAWPSPSMPEHLWPIAIIGWTLNYEMFFYLIFGLALLLPHRFRLAAVGVPLVCAVALGHAVEASAQVEFYMSPLLLEFVAGIGIAHWYMSGYRFSTIACILAVVTSILLFAASAPVYEESMRGVMWGVPAALLVGASAFLGRNGMWPKSRVMTLLGASSYSLYLSHYLALEALNKAWNLAGLPFGAGFLIVGLLSCIVGGILVHLVVEVRIARLFGRRNTTLAPVGI